jgi:hypothetical protein
MLGAPVTPMIIPVPLADDVARSATPPRASPRFSFATSVLLIVLSHCFLLVVLLFHLHLPPAPAASPATPAAAFL